MYSRRTRQGAGGGRGLEGKGMDATDCLIFSVCVFGCGCCFSLGKALRSDLPPVCAHHPLGEGPRCARCLEAEANHHPILP